MKGIWRPGIATWTLTYVIQCAHRDMTAATHVLPAHAQHRPEATDVLVIRDTKVVGKWENVPVRMQPQSQWWSIPRRSISSHLLNNWNIQERWISYHLCSFVACSFWGFLLVCLSFRVCVCPSVYFILCVIVCLGIIWLIVCLSSCMCYCAVCVYLSIVFGFDVFKGDWCFFTFLINVFCFAFLNCFVK